MLIFIITCCGFWMVYVSHRGGCNRSISSILPWPPSTLMPGNFRHFAISFGISHWNSTFTPPPFHANNSQTSNLKLLDFLFILCHQGQQIMIHLHNHLLSDSVTIHWHGLSQWGTPWMDGVGYISQCPIGAGQIYFYNFTVSSTSIRGFIFK